MAAEPTQEPKPSSGALDAFRKVAESVSAYAQRYDRTHPGYPEMLARRLLAVMPGREVLDVGIGTGLSAGPLRDVGCHVVGVEVDPGMAAVAREHGFEVEEAHFETWDPAGRTFDGVICGQAWHSIDPEAGAMTACSLLKPGGRFAAFWNIGDPDPEVAAGFAEVYRKLQPSLPVAPWAEPTLNTYSRMLSAVTQGLARTGKFGAPEEWRFPWRATVTRESWLDIVPELPGHNWLPPDRLRPLLDGMGAVIDAVGGAFEMSYTTVVVTAERR